MRLEAALLHDQAQFSRIFCTLEGSTTPCSRSIETMDMPQVEMDFAFKLLN